MELDLQSLFGLPASMCSAVLIGWDPATPPSPRIWAHVCTRALLVSQDRRHLFVTPCLPQSAVLPSWVCFFYSLFAVYRYLCSLPFLPASICCFPIVCSFVSCLPSVVFHMSTDLLPAVYFQSLLLCMLFTFHTRWLTPSCFPSTVCSSVGCLPSMIYYLIFSVSWLTTAVFLQQSAPPYAV